jgi:ABC transporter with metal-binding/Fe-S-binding domain ATP-binding protein
MNNATGLRVAALISGGKDSLYAMYRAMQLGRNIICMVALKSSNPSSYLFHTPNIEVTKLQAKACGIPLISKKTKGIKEEELKDLKVALQQAKTKYGIDAVVSGAVASEYQRYRFETVCADLGLKSIAPLWQLEPEKYLMEMLAKDKFEVIFTAVASGGFNEKWLGRKFDELALADLRSLHERFGVHLSGEGGEYETLVLDCPIFKKKIEITEAEPKWNADSGIYNIRKAKLISKGKR